MLNLAIFIYLNLKDYPTILAKSSPSWENRRETQKCGGSRIYFQSTHPFFSLPIQVSILKLIHLKLPVQILLKMTKWELRTPKANWHIIYENKSA